MKFKFFVACLYFIIHTGTIFSQVSYGVLVGANYNDMYRTIQPKRTGDLTQPYESAFDYTLGVMGSIKPYKFLGLESTLQYQRLSRTIDDKSYSQPYLMLSLSPQLYLSPHFRILGGVSSGFILKETYPDMNKWHNIGHFGFGILAGKFLIDARFMHSIGAFWQETIPSYTLNYHHRAVQVSIGYYLWKK